MSNPGLSPFGRSQLLRRSPPPTPLPSEQHQQRDPEPSAPTDVAVEIICTPEIQKWMGAIETILSEICTIVADGKMNTDQKLRVTNLCRKVSHGTSQLAVQYQSLKQKTLQAQVTIQHLQGRQDIADSIEEIKKAVEKDRNIGSVSYANVVKKGQDLIRPANFQSLAIYPADRTQSSDDTKTLVQKIISPEELKLRVRGMKKIRNGGVIISADSKGDIEKLKASEKLVSSGLKCEEPSKRRPRIAVIGVPVALTEKEVLDCIFEQNLSEKLTNTSRESFLENIKLSHKSGKKDRPTCNFILEVPASIRKMLITQGRIFINWTSCPVRDFTIVTRCFNCQQFGHAAKFCRETSPTCNLCGETGHAFKECPNKSRPLNCGTCKRFKRKCDHPTGDMNCPARKYAEDNFINSIDYEGA
nr:uncharacterized protein LOC126056926 [Helicoverpa armigera]